MRKAFVAFLFASLLPFTAGAVTCDNATYTKLQYLTSSGTEYIDTGITFELAKDFRVTGSVINPSTGPRKIIVGNFNRGAGVSTFNLELVSGGIFRTYVSKYGTFTTDRGDPNGALPGNTLILYDSSYNATSHSVTNHLEYGGTTTTDTFETVNSGDDTLSSLWLFLDKRGATSCSSSDTGCPESIGATKIYKDGTLVRDFIPVRRNSDGVLGMCDTVSGHFFTNDGSGNFVAGPVVCNAGYYNNNGTCTRCVNGYYCPGNDTMVQCPENTHTPEEISALSGADLESSTNGWYISSRAITDYPSDITDCFIAFSDGHIDGGYFYQVIYHWDTGTQNYEQNLGLRVFHRADNGYYLSDVYHSDYYYNIYACTNAPLNTHYVGPGTPDVGNCPWECDAGYGRTKNDTCEPLCSAGITKLKTSTGLSFNVYAAKTTTPSINIKPDNTNTVCYVNLATGNATNAINIRYGNTIYHTTN